MAVPLAVPLIAGGLGLVGSALSARESNRAGRAANREWDQLRSQAGREHTAARGRADTSRNTFESALTGFDPMSYMQKQAGALHAGLSEDLGHQRGARAASLNRRGLFRSDIGGAGEMRDFNTRLSQGLAGMAGQAAGMEQQRHSQLGQLYGQDRDSANRYFDAVTGLGATQIQGNQRRRAERAEGFGNLAGSLFNFGGAMAGAM